MDQHTADSVPGRGRLWEVTATVLKGMVGGLIGTVSMTVYRVPLFAGLPPTAEFWARFVGDGDPADYPLQALGLHLLYGAGAGGVFGLLSSSVGVDRGRASASILLATGYSVVLSVLGSRLLLRRLLGIELTAQEALVFHVGHVIYGLSLGTWLGTGNLIERPDDD